MGTNEPVVIQLILIQHLQEAIIEMCQIVMKQC
jgi:hypothetical protein